MDFRAAIRSLAGPELSEDDSMDPTMMGADAPGEGGWQPNVDSDGLDPAAPGGPSPYNAEPPNGSEPAATDPLWKNPDEPNVQGADMPHIKAPSMNSQTLHNARKTRYESMERVR